MIKEIDMGNVIDFQKKKEEKDKKEEARLFGNILKEINHLLPKKQNKNTEDTEDPPPGAA
ncbi:MAG: hypothetical protein AAB396_01000 [Patescibacteria group bacterium]